MTLGIFIGRLNPPHIGHISTIKKSLEQDSKILVLLGTPLVLDENNPLNFKERKEILKKIFKNNSNLQILELKDTKTDLEWIENILDILKSSLSTAGPSPLKNIEGIKKNINFYGGDFENDSAILVLKEYQRYFKNYNINYTLNSREKSFIEFEGKKYKISATNLRKALKERKYNLAKKFCDSKIFEYIKKKVI